ncbi:hypothetical protein SANTM175S_06170 [Streptomyces antimycoticus]
MPPTLASLVRHPGLKLSVLAGEDRLETPVRWAHVSELADPVPTVWEDGDTTSEGSGSAVPDTNEAVTHAFWLAGRKATGESTLEVTSPWDGHRVGVVSVPTDAQIEEAVAAADAVREEFAATPAHVRPPRWTMSRAASPSAVRRSPG